MLSKSDIKYIQSLSHKKFRDQEGLFIVEGLKMVDELLKEHQQKVRKIFAVREWLDKHQTDIHASISTQAVEEFELLKISSQKTPHQVLALVEIPLNPIKSYKPTGLTLVLDRIQDPGNLGTIIRTCDWFGVTEIVCSADTVDVFNSKVVQSAMGSILRVHVYYTELTDFIRLHKDMPSYAAVLGGTSIHEIDVKQPAFLIIGNESTGISNELLQLNPFQISIPKIGKAESLNAAVAASIILSACMK
jgi:TrmH family RNA methyltransferase